MFTSTQILKLTNEFEKLANFHHKKKKISLKEQLELQLQDAKRQGDSDWIKELEERIQELNLK